ncbi:MAG: MBL fold metallo-hydrolase [Aeromicrobium sp.]|uniref:MBL fold metallo-hydrolase n=1 Tax=Aeromicrobium sp. TaxID=1871063 RepID=UPI0025B97424|nr:MBL fold metallo-hydrolase [Aeromicrobium sp.]MCK5891021.1 MBL fold metallo-hydrolase [Aeromicrobium sp.]MDF1705215.1 MBL fold metallo-hydrolase [Aeromicrobium sp.]
MTYTGEVEVGGPADVQDAGDLEITKLAVGPMANNVYLLRCTLTDERLVIDAADEAERVLEVLDGAPVKRIVTTHRHPDHWGALEALRAVTGAETIAGERDAEGIEVVTDVLVATGARVRVGSCELEVVELVGHTPGSIALAYDDPDGIVHLFTGDSLFPGGVGKTSSEEDFTSLIDDVETKLFGRFPDDTHVYPGHGNDTTLGAERPSLPEWRSRGW